MESLLMGKGYKSLQSVNYHNSCAHGYERFEILAWLMGLGMIWIDYVWLVNCSGQLWLGGVIYRWKGKVTYSLGKVVNFIIYRVDIT
jgi:hypothetical protein